MDPEDLRLSAIEPLSPRTMRNLSPAMIERKLEHQINIDDEKVANDIENNLTCCCMRQATDKRLLTFFSQILISLIVLVFSLVKLSGDDIEDKSYYMSVVTLLIGYFIPSPQLTQKK